MRVPRHALSPSLCVFVCLRMVIRDCAGCNDTSGERERDSDFEFLCRRQTLPIVSFVDMPVDGRQLWHTR